MPRPDGTLDPALAERLRGKERAPAPGPSGWSAAVLAALAGERAAAGGGVSGVPLDPRVAERVSALGTAELVVGIPSFNNARTIGHVVRAVAAGLAKHFPGRRAVIVNSDGGSRDGTAEVVAAADFGAPQAILVSHPVDPVHKIVTPYHGLPGKGSALRTIFAIAERLGRPRLRGRGLRPAQHHPAVDRAPARAPVWSTASTTSPRSTCATSTTARSRTRSCTRSPARSTGGRCGSRSAASSASPAGWPRTTSRRPVWETDVARFGIDIWMTTTAIADGFRVCQSFLGAKIHDPKDPGADLAAMLVQVVSAVFDLMETYHERWAAVRGRRRCRSSASRTGSGSSR